MVSQAVQSCQQQSSPRLHTVTTNRFPVASTHDQYGQVWYTELRRRFDPRQGVPFSSDGRDAAALLDVLSATKCGPWAPRRSGSRIESDLGKSRDLKRA